MSFARLLAGAMILTLCLATGASAQYGSGTIDAGTTVTVRTNQTIDAKNSDGQVYSGVVDQDVMNRNGGVAIPKGSNVELVVKNVSNNEVALDLNAIMVNGQRYTIDTQDNVVSSDRKEGIGANKRTGKYVGGGAVIGAVIGAIAGGGKGAAIGAGAGAAAGAGTQVLTRGKSVNVPAESLLTFRLQQPLQTGFAASSDRRYSNGSNTSAAYRAGLVAGRSDADRNLARNTRSNRWTSTQDRRDYEAGYNSGYEGRVASDNSVSSTGTGSLHIGADNNITWQAPATARVFVQVDNDAARLFAEGASGTQQAPWIESGHLYVFMLRDQNGNEIARDQLDLRSRNRRYSR
jgi:hypothetical protein